MVIGVSVLRLCYIGACMVTIVGVAVTLVVVLNRGVSWISERVLTAQLCVSSQFGGRLPLVCAETRLDSSLIVVPSIV